MEFADYIRIARRQWLLIVGMTVAALVGAALLTAQMTPLYASGAKIFVSSSPSTSSEAYQGGLFSQQRVKSYADLATGLELSDRVITRLRLDLTPSELAKKIEARVVPDTVLLSIKVTDPSAAEAQRINNAVVDLLTDYVAELETPPGEDAPVLKTTIVDPPRLPDNPVSPQPLRNMGLALVLGLLLGFGLAVARELIDTSVRGIGDVPELEDAPVLATLVLEPDIVKDPLISSLPSHAPRAEAFRVLRTNLQFIDVDTASKSFVVTSSIPDEGKSTTAINTAMAMSQAGQNVLLIDADMRRPRIASHLGLENAVGLTTRLVGKVSLADALQEHADTGLQVLTSGAIPPNPAELLQSQAMNDLLAEVREQFDVVIIDAPPLLPVTDASLLAAKTDGAILVIHHSKTTSDQVAGAVERIESVEGNLVGVVFNKVPRKRGIGGYGYGYGYGYGPTEDQPIKGLRRLFTKKPA